MCVCVSVCVCVCVNVCVYAFVCSRYELSSVLRGDDGECPFDSDGVVVYTFPLTPFLFDTLFE